MRTSPSSGFFAAVLDLVELRAAIELDVDGVILIDVQVGELFNLHKFIPRNVGVEVDRDDVCAHVEADVVAVEALADEARADVLARMLLHVVKAARPVDLAGDALSHFEGLVAKVRDDAVFSWTSSTFASPKTPVSYGWPPPSG